MGAYPRVVDWNEDGRKDLLIGEAGGKVALFTNIGTDAAPIFDAGVFLQVGPPGSKTDINVGARATPNVVDWDNDGDFSLPGENISTFVFEASWEYGRDYASQLNGRSKDGSCRFSAPIPPTAWTAK
jgi:hypothetical protein